MVLRSIILQARTSFISSLDIDAKLATLDVINADEFDVELIPLQHNEAVVISG